MHPHLPIPRRASLQSPHVDRAEPRHGTSLCFCPPSIAPPPPSFFPSAVLLTSMSTYPLSSQSILSKVSGGGGGRDLDLDLGADLKAHRPPGEEHDGVPDDSTYGPAMPYEMHSQGPRWTLPSTVSSGACCGPRHAFVQGRAQGRPVCRGQREQPWRAQGMPQATRGAWPRAARGWRFRRGQVGIGVEPGAPHEASGA